MQFSLRSLFYVMTWLASIAGLAVGRYRGWTVFAAGFSLACINSSGRLHALQNGKSQTQMFRIAWLLLLASLLLPAVQGCGTTTYQGWQAAITCGQLLVEPIASDQQITNAWAYCYWCVLMVANLLLAGSPLFLWRLRRGKGHCYGTLLPVAAAAMWCLAVGDPRNLLVGYYAWCMAAVAMMCAYRLHWAVLPLMGLAPLLVWLAQGEPERILASPQGVIQARPFTKPARQAGISAGSKPAIQGSPIRYRISMFLPGP